MNFKTPSDVDAYLLAGCGRCPLGNTPQCKVHTWEKELAALRRLVLDTGLTEEIKWSVPCYTFQGSNILLVTAFKEYCALSFFKGALLQDTDGLLDKPGEHTQSARLIRFTDVRQIVELEPVLKAYVYEAVEVEKAGLKADFKEKTALEFPEELLKRLDEDPVLKAAFEALTPGRQRGYSLHFSAPKQAETRAARVEKCIPKILQGKGFHDR